MGVVARHAGQAAEGVFGNVVGGGGRDLGAVSGEHLGQDVDGGVRVGGARGEDLMGVGFGGLDVNVAFVGRPGHCDVHLLASEVR